MSTPHVTTIGLRWQTSTPVMAPLWNGWQRMANSEEEGGEEEEEALATAWRAEDEDNECEPGGAEEDIAPSTFGIRVAFESVKDESES